MIVIQKVVNGYAIYNCEEGKVDYKIGPVSYDQTHIAKTPDDVLCLVGELLTKETRTPNPVTLSPPSTDYETTGGPGGLYPPPETQA